LDFSAYGYSLVPVIVLLVSIFRRAGLPKRYLPVGSIALGVLSGWFYLYPDDPKRAVLEGVVLGLISVGIWSGTKNTFEKVPPKE
jgi:hypothetical protein